jgi:membrane-anchored protein YejM (alkaline phosphatase superfamily)
MNKKNIIWFVVDGVRAYKSGIDDRDKVDIMDEVAKEAVEFENAFTSTPSSVLSASTMFTGLPSAYISRHYNDFEFDETEIDSIVTMLEKNDYSIYSIFDAKALRCGLQTMAHSLPAKYRPKTSDHDKWWHNAEITKNVDHLFKKDHVKKPSFFLMWYNCRKDPKTSDHVKDAINIFKENGMWDDSIVIMNSDHGYPDPSTGLTVEFMKQYSHDMIVTDDNSRIPLILKYPGCPKGAKIKNLVRTSDIFHTLIELLDFDNIDKSKMNYSNPNNGKSLINLINGKDNSARIARIDTRLGMSNSRTTALRSDTYKYVYHVDQNKEEFYDIIADPYEMKDIILSNDFTVKSEIGKFRDLYKTQEADIFDYHSQKLKENLLNEIDEYFKGPKKNEVKNILLTCTPTTPYIVLKLLVE